MKVIWDAQSRQPMYAIDQSTLHSRVQAHGQAIEQRVNLAEGAMTLIFLVLAIAVISEPLVEGHDWHQLLDGLLYLIIVLFLLSGFVQRRRRAQQFDATIRGDLDRAISDVEHHIGRWKSMRWWCLLPLATTTLIGFCLLYDRKPLWLWPLAIGSFVLIEVCARRDLTRRLIPKRTELMRLRELLTREAPPSSTQ